MPSDLEVQGNLQPEVNEKYSKVKNVHIPDCVCRPAVASLGPVHDELLLGGPEDSAGCEARTPPSSAAAPSSSPEEAPRTSGCAGAGAAPHVAHSGGWLQPARSSHVTRQSHVTPPVAGLGHGRSPGGGLEAGSRVRPAERWCLRVDWVEEVGAGGRPDQREAKAIGNTRWERKKYRTCGRPGLKSWLVNSGKSWDRSKEVMSTSWPTGSGFTAEQIGLSFKNKSDSGRNIPLPSPVFSSGGGGGRGSLRHRRKSSSSGIPGPRLVGRRRCMVRRELDTCCETRSWPGCSGPRC